MSKDKESKELIDHGIFLLTGTIGENVDDAIKFILEGNLEEEHDHLVLMINSEGGYVTDGFALIDVMAGSQTPVHTVGIGCLASMALSAFIAGAKGTRTLTPNTLILAHQWSGVRFGKEHELLASRKGDELITEMIMRHYKKYTGMSERDVRKYLLPPSDIYLTATEAKKLGLCDHVKNLQ